MKVKSSKNLLVSAMLSMFAIVSGAAAQAANSEVQSGTITRVAEVAQLEQIYKLHSQRRNEIAKKLSLLWFEERELVADYENGGRTGDIAETNELASELRGVREKIDGARAELAYENKIINSVGELMPE